VRRLIHIAQETTVEDYVAQFSALMDHIAAYESSLDQVHYTTKFLDGLKPGVRLVAIQQPRDLDTAYSLALLYEELDEETVPAPQPPLSVQVPRRLYSPASYSPLPQPPPPPSRWVSKLVEEKKAVERQKTASEDKWQNLKAYRRSKGLCFICGERWGREHQCKTNIQLHIVQEMIECMQSPECNDSDFSDGEQNKQSGEHLCLLSTAAMNPSTAGPRTMQLRVEIQGHQFLFLVDSGSSSCFIDSQHAELLSGKVALELPVPVKVAGGAILKSKQYFPSLLWEADGARFTDTFKVLELASYDGIIGLDWLGKYSPMLTHWEQGWIAIQHEGRQIVLHGDVHVQCTHALVELHLIQEHERPEKVIPVEIQEILDEFASVFAAPSGLPPRRRYDHHIPLIPGARPVSIRPYRVAPELKDEIERQVKEMLAQGTITHSNSAFGSPVVLVKEEERDWRLVVDYRQLNALTVKGRYPLPIIDELLDELAGAKWFSKLDLKAGYHQIRLAPGEEHKTAFQTHNGHYEFNVMAFGLTGAPATFQHAMNATLEPDLRKFAVVFFDDILVYNPVILSIFTICRRSFLFSRSISGRSRPASVFSRNELSIWATLSQLMRFPRTIQKSRLSKIGPSQLV